MKAKLSTTMVAVTRNFPTPKLRQMFRLRYHRVQAMKLAANRHLANGFYPFVFQGGRS